MHQLFEDICHSMSKEEIYCGELANGLKWIFVPSGGRLSHAALMFGSGSRNETEDETGLAHFTEHNLFKGTAKKTSLQVLSRIDSVGGNLYLCFLLYAASCKSSRTAFRHRFFLGISGGGNCQGKKSGAG